MKPNSLSLALHITRRNWTVYKKDFIANISPTFADPLFFILSLGLGLGAFIHELNGKTYIAFLAPGLAVSTALMTSFFETSYGFYVRMTFENVYKAMLTTPINPKEVIFGEFIWVGLKGAFMCLGVTIVFIFFGLVKNLTLLPLVLWIGMLVALGCGALGLLASAFVKNINQFQSVYSFFISPLFFFSGIFFPIEQMPAAAQFVAYLFPLAHGVKLAQAVYWDENLVHALFVHSGAMIVQIIILGYLAFWAIQRRLTN
jgi:lipooligosaccharide transport system permease protein